MAGQRRGITLLECLVTLVSASIVLGGFAVLYTTADLAARGNIDDINGSAIDYNLDRVLSDIAAGTTGTGLYPTRRVYEAVDHTALSPNCIVVYERPVSIRSTIAYLGALGPPAGTATFNNIAANAGHPFPVFFDSLTGSPAGMTNVDPNLHPANWLTGIVALYRRDVQPPIPPNLKPRYRTAILWHAELPMSSMAQYGLPLSFVQSRAGVGYPTFMTEAAVRALCAGAQAHQTFAGARVLGLGIHEFIVNGQPRNLGTPASNVEPMTWKVVR